MTSADSSAYYVYIVRCSDDTFYTGTSTNVARRVYGHNHLKSAARYTKTRRPVVLVYTEKAATKGAALSREAALKKLSRQEKQALVAAALKVA